MGDAAMTPSYPIKNSKATVWVDTSMHRATLCEFEADATYPLPNFPAPVVEVDPALRVTVWRVLFAIAAAVAAFIYIAIWRLPT
jgi:hypothetical protein